ncbi:hypothetical protein [Xenorhabdus sp. PB30.3]|uniref:hypothetical protein n=1 Tax=Xenorhabdus sp. PB30.3 TaxID=2788941 RepID=UPI001E46DAD8|nr:hypothetical protein [Xenorhabdus sp. PB30.3]MCC8379828.1 hypothetical protein [Xenorhabdus sp. PB30.3]
MHWVWKISNKMEKIIISSVIFFCLHGVSWALRDNMPKDLQEYMKKTEYCEYLAGEWDSDLSDARKRLLEDEIDIFCKKANELFYELKEKYKDDPREMEIINEHSELIKYYAEKPIE